MPDSQDGLSSLVDRSPAPEVNKERKSASTILVLRTRKNWCSLPVLESHIPLPYPVSENPNRWLAKAASGRGHQALPETNPEPEPEYSQKLTAIQLPPA